jgi:hypothetical protein
MVPLERLRAWWLARRPLPLDRKLAVAFDAETVQVRVLERLGCDWEQFFRWEEVVKVCFKDEGAYSSDILFIYLRDKERPVVVLTEARGGVEFFGALCERGLFPPHVMRAAMSATDGGMYCWPERPLSHHSGMP